MNIYSYVHYYFNIINKLGQLNIYNKYMMKKKLIFLCHGNICRSPMAEFIFKDRLKKLGLEDLYEVTSKALSNEEIGNDIYEPAKRCLKQHGIPYERHYASRFTLSDYDYYDKIYVMDDSNMYLIKRMTDDPEGKIELLNGYIEDPWYSDNYDKVFDLISEGINAILSKDI